MTIWICWIIKLPNVSVKLIFVIIYFAAIGFISKLANIHFIVQQYVNNISWLVAGYFISHSWKAMYHSAKPIIQYTSGVHLTQAYDVTIQRPRNSHAKIQDNEMHILRCMGSKFCMKFQGCSMKFHTKCFSLYTTKYAFCQVLKLWLWYIRVKTS